MESMVESLEGRTFLAAHGVPARLLAVAEASSSSAVQAKLAEVNADLDVINVAKTQTQSNPNQLTLSDAIHNGLELLKTDRQAVRDSRGDTAALSAAKAKLQSDTAQLKQHVSTSRVALRQSIIETKAALKDAVASLRVDVRELRDVVRNPPLPGSATGGKLIVTRLHEVNPVVDPAPTSSSVVGDPLYPT